MDCYEFEDSLDYKASAGYTEKPCLETKQNTHTQTPKTIKTKEVGRDGGGGKERTTLDMVIAST